MVDTAASAQTVYDQLVDVRSWPAWSGMDSAELAAPDTDGSDGVGSVRALTRGRFHGLDRVVELAPGRRFAYEHVGLPVRDYRGEVDLEPIPTGTRITWQSTFRPKYVGTGWIWQYLIRRLLRQMTTGLAEHAAADRD